jgi:enoyl-CoA hydratase/carnithine racemase
MAVRTALTITGEFIFGFLYSVISIIPIWRPASNRTDAKDTADDSQAGPANYGEIALSEPALIIEEQDGILIATLNRPNKLNALNQEIFETLTAAVHRYAATPELRVFLIRATGRYFCAGADLMGGIPAPDTGGTSLVREWYRVSMGPGMQRLYDEIEAIEKPFVAAHHAPCVGGGLEMSLSCDFRLAARSARYSFPEAKLGSIPASGGVSRLTRLAGVHWAKWLILANQHVDAAQALNIGLIHAVYEDEEFEAKVMEFCRNLAAQPPEMATMAKLTIELAGEASANDARKIERLGQSVLQVGEEQRAMLAAMQAKLRG